MHEHIDIMAVAKTCGLHYMTVRELLQKGWRYEEIMGEPPRWVAPVQ